MVTRNLSGFTLQANQVADGRQKTNGGRWVTYNGGELSLVVESLCPPDASGHQDPIRGVIDLDTLQAHAPTIPALRDHDDHKLSGSWSDLDISAKNGIIGSLTLAKPGSPNSLVYVQEIIDLLEAKAPLQASIGAMPRPGVGHWEEVPAGQSVTVNGRIFTADDGAKLCILRNGELYETSVLTFGADSHTGRIAATLSKERPMSATTKTPPTLAEYQARQKALMAKVNAKHHGRIAAMMAEDNDDAAIMKAVDDEEAKDKDKQLADLAATCDALQKRCDAHAADMTAVQAEHAAAIQKLTAARADGGQSIAATAAAGAEPAKVTAAKAGQTAGIEAATISDGMRILIKEGAKLTGQQLRAAALARWPKAARQ